MPRITAAHAPVCRDALHRCAPRLGHAQPLHMLCYRQNVVLAFGSWGLATSRDTIFFVHEGLALIDKLAHVLHDLPKNESGYVGSSRVDLQACKLEYSIVSPK